MKQKAILLILLSSILFANDSTVLSNTKQQIIELEKQQINEKANSNKYDWIEDINLKASISKNQDDIQSEDYYISISQDIFKFGGISSQIDYAKELRKMEKINLDISTKSDISTLYSLLLDIKLNEISIAQNNLSIKNSQIEITDKKSEYKAGELGISDLNEAIMTKNSLQDTLKTLHLSKLTNINSVKKYTTKKYQNISIPRLKLMSKEVFLDNASLVKYKKSDINVNNTLYELEKSDYLPSVSADAKYGYENDDTSNGDDYYTYGLSITMPLNYKYSSDIEQKKIDYLMSRKELDDEINDALNTYSQSILTIQNFKDRIVLAKEDIKLYEELLSITKEEYEAGYKTLDDVDTLENSKNIRTLDIENYELNIQKEILSLYYQM